MDEAQKRLVAVVLGRQTGGSDARQQAELPGGRRGQPRAQKQEDRQETGRSEAASSQDAVIRCGPAPPWARRGWAS